jgi:DNA-binding IscR family transcriptional regulator
VLDLNEKCEYEDVCTSASPMRAVNQRIVEMLDGIPLADLIATAAPIPSDS